MAGTYNAAVSAPGCETSPTNSYTLAAGDTTAQTVQLTKLAKVTGKIVSQLLETPSGGPTPTQAGVNGLRVTLTGHASGNTTAVETLTGTDGTFTFGDVVGLIDGHVHARDRPVPV